MTRQQRPKNPRKAGKKNIEDKYFSKVVGKALDILELVKRSPNPMTLNELTLRVGMAKSSVFRILYTLEVTGYIEKNEMGQYVLPARVRSWLSRYSVKEIMDAASPRMSDLSRQVSETVSLGVLFDNHIEVVSVVESLQLIRMGNTVGRIIPPHASSMGKAIIAFQSSDRAKELLRSFGLHRFTQKTITDQIELENELMRTRKRGWSTDREESVLEGFCFGAPIFRDQEVLAAISISIPEMRRPKGKQQEDVVGKLLATASEISKVLSQEPAE